MSPIELAARALMALDYPEEAGGEMGEFYMDRHGDAYRAQARAVIVAIREPSEDMVEAGACPEFGLVLVAKWQAMIDAMLEEGK